MALRLHAAGKRVTQPSPALQPASVTPASASSTWESHTSKFCAVAMLPLFLCAVLCAVLCCGYVAVVALCCGAVCCAVAIFLVFLCALLCCGYVPDVALCCAVLWLCSSCSFVIIYFPIFFEALCKVLEVHCGRVLVRVQCTLLWFCCYKHCAEWGMEQGTSGSVHKDSTLRGKPVVKRSSWEVPWYGACHFKLPVTASCESSSPTMQLPNVSAIGIWGGRRLATSRHLLRGFSSASASSTTPPPSAAWRATDTSGMTSCGMCRMSTDSGAPMTAPGRTSLVTIEGSYSLRRCTRWVTTEGSYSLRVDEEKLLSACS
jgi:hypothetical protein